MRDFVKLYLRLDDDEEDTLIDVFIESAREYIIGAVGYYDENINLTKLIVATLCAEWYNNRSYTAFSNGKNISNDTRKIVLSMLAQLRYKNKG